MTALAQQLPHASSNWLALNWGENCAPNVFTHIASLAEIALAHLNLDEMLAIASALLHALDRLNMNGLLFSETAAQGLVLALQTLWPFLLQTSIGRSRTLEACLNLRAVATTHLITQHNLLAELLHSLSSHQNNSSEPLPEGVPTDLTLLGHLVDQRLRRVPHPSPHSATLTMALAVLQHMLINVATAHEGSRDINKEESSTPAGQRRFLTEFVRILADFDPANVTTLLLRVTETHEDTLLLATELLQDVVATQQTAGNGVAIRDVIVTRILAHLCFNRLLLLIDGDTAFDKASDALVHEASVEAANLFETICDCWFRYHSNEADFGPFDVFQALLAPRCMITFFSMIQSGSPSALQLQAYFSEGNANHTLGFLRAGLEAMCLIEPATLTTTHAQATVSRLLHAIWSWCETYAPNLDGVQDQLVGAHPILLALDPHPEPHADVPHDTHPESPPATPVASSVPESLDRLSVRSANTDAKVLLNIDRDSVAPMAADLVDKPRMVRPVLEALDTLDQCLLTICRLGELPIEPGTGAQPASPSTPAATPSPVDTNGKHAMGCLTLVYAALLRRAWANHAGAYGRCWSALAKRIATHFGQSPPTSTSLLHTVVQGASRATMLNEDGRQLLVFALCQLHFGSGSAQRTPPPTATSTSHPDPKELKTSIDPDLLETACHAIPALTEHLLERGCRYLLEELSLLVLPALETVCMTPLVFSPSLHAVAENAVSHLLHQGVCAAQMQQWLVNARSRWPAVAAFRALRLGTTAPASGVDGLVGERGPRRFWKFDARSYLVFSKAQSFWPSSSHQQGFSLLFWIRPRWQLEFLEQSRLDSSAIDGAGSSAVPLVQIHCCDETGRVSGHTAWTIVLSPNSARLGLHVSLSHRSGERQEELIWFGTNVSNEEWTHVAISHQPLGDGEEASVAAATAAAAVAAVHDEEGSAFFPSPSPVSPSRVRSSSSTAYGADFATARTSGHWQSGVATAYLNGVVAASQPIHLPLREPQQTHHTTVLCRRVIVRQAASTATQMMGSPESAASRLSRHGSLRAVDSAVLSIAEASPMAMPWSAGQASSAGHSQPPPGTPQLLHSRSHLSSSKSPMPVFAEDTVPDMDAPSEVSEPSRFRRFFASVFGRTARRQEDLNATIQRMHSSEPQNVLWQTPGVPSTPVNGRLHFFPSEADPIFVSTSPPNCPSASSIGHSSTFLSPSPQTGWLSSHSPLHVAPPSARSSLRSIPPPKLDLGPVDASVLVSDLPAPQRHSTSDYSQPMVPTTDLGALTALATVLSYEQELRRAVVLFLTPDTQAAYWRPLHKDELWHERQASSNQIMNVGISEDNRLASRTTSVASSIVGSQSDTGARTQASAGEQTLSETDSLRETVEVDEGADTKSTLLDQAAGLQPLISDRRDVLRALGEFSGVQALLLLLADAAPSGEHQLELIETILSVVEQDPHLAHQSKNEHVYRLLGHFLASSRCELTEALLRCLLRFCVNYSGSQNKESIAELVEDLRALVNFLTATHPAQKLKIREGTFWKRAKKSSKDDKDQDEADEPASGYSQRRLSFLTPSPRAQRSGTTSWASPSGAFEKGTAPDADMAGLGAISDKARSPPRRIKRSNLGWSQHSPFAAIAEEGSDFEPDSPASRQPGEAAMVDPIESTLLRRRLSPLPLLSQSSTSSTDRHVDAHDQPYRNVDSNPAGNTEDASEPSNTDSPGPTDAVDVRVGLLSLVLDCLCRTGYDDNVLSRENLDIIFVPDTLLAMADHEDSTTRLMVLRLIIFCLQRGLPNFTKLFRRAEGFHVLAKQLTEHVVTRPIFMAALNVFIGRVDLRRSASTKTSASRVPSTANSPSRPSFSSHRSSREDLQSFATSSSAGQPVEHALQGTQPLSATDAGSAAHLIAALFAHLVSDATLCHEALGTLTHLVRLRDDLREPLLNANIVAVLCEILTIATLRAPSKPPSPSENVQSGSPTANASLDADLLANDPDPDSRIAAASSAAHAEQPSWRSRPSTPASSAVSHVGCFSLSARKALLIVAETFLTELSSLHVGPLLLQPRSAPTGLARLESMINCLTVWGLPHEHAKHLQRSMLLTLLDQMQAAICQPGRGTKVEATHVPLHGAVATLCGMAVDLVLYDSGVAATLPDTSLVNSAEVAAACATVAAAATFASDSSDPMTSGPDSDEASWMVVSDVLRENWSTLSDHGFVWLLIRWLQDMLDHVRALLGLGTSSVVRHALPRNSTQYADARVVERMLSEQLLRLLLWLLHLDLLPNRELDATLQEPIWQKLPQRLQQLGLGIDQLTASGSLWARLVHFDSSFVLVLKSLHSAYHRLRRLRDDPDLPDKSPDADAVVHSIDVMLDKCELAFRYVIRHHKPNLQGAVDLDGSRLGATRGGWYLKFYRLTENETFSTEIELARKNWLEARAADEAERVEQVLLGQRRITTHLTAMVTRALQLADLHRKAYLEHVTNHSHELNLCQTLWHRIEERAQQPGSIWYRPEQGRKWMLDPREGLLRMRRKLQPLRVAVDMANRAHDYWEENPGNPAADEALATHAANASSAKSPDDDALEHTRLVNESMTSNWSLEASLTQTPTRFASGLSLITPQPDTPLTLTAGTLRRGTACLAPVDEETAELERPFAHVGSSASVLGNEATDASQEDPMLAAASKLLHLVEAMEDLPTCSAGQMDVRGLAALVEQRGHAGAISSAEALTLRPLLLCPTALAPVSANSLAYLHHQHRGAGTLDDAAAPGTDVNEGGLSTSIDPRSTVTESTDVPEAAEDNMGSMQPHERVQAVLACEIVTPYESLSGEVILGDRHLYFQINRTQQKAPGLTQLRSVKELAALSHDPNQLPCWPYAGITQVLRRRYLLQHVGLEIFFDSGVTLMLAFGSSQLCREAHTCLMQQKLPSLCMLTVMEINGSEDADATPKLSVFRVSGNDRQPRSAITQQWIRGDISNFEYLMHLNTLAGRTFNDLTQYPVMPHVLRDYTSARLDLQNEEVFRDLSKPMGALGEQRLESILRRYADLKENWEMELEMAHLRGEEPDINTMPFMYGTHYSSAAAVLFYMSRLEPFTQLAVELQGGKLDIPDRMFHDMADTWLSCSERSSSDVKELIPEFFTLPEFLRNINHYELGRRQDGQVLEDVCLPPWAGGSPRTFVYLQMRALESPYVSAHLHEWIDLIFGTKQRGPAAVEASNVFVAASYEGVVDLEKEQSPSLRKRVLDSAKHFGQTPIQLFQNAHPRRLASACNWPVNLTHVGGRKVIGEILRRTVNKDVHHLAFLPGRVIKVYRRLRCPLLRDGQIFQLDADCWDGNLHVLDARGHPTGCNLPCGAFAALAGASGVVHVLQLHVANNQVSLAHMGSLYGRGAPMVHIAMCTSFGVVVTADEDGRVFIWDLHQLSLLHVLLTAPDETITALAVSAITGDIAVGRARAQGGTSPAAAVEIVTINGESVTSWKSPSKVTALAYINYRNLANDCGLLVGNADAGVTILRAHDLNELWSVSGRHVMQDFSVPDTGICGIQALAVAEEDHRFYVATEGALDAFAKFTRLNNILMLIILQRSDTAGDSLFKSNTNITNVGGNLYVRVCPAVVKDSNPSGSYDRGGRRNEPCRPRQWQRGSTASSYEQRSQAEPMADYVILREMVTTNVLDCSLSATICCVSDKVFYILYISKVAMDLPTGMASPPVGPAGAFDRMGAMPSEVTFESLGALAVRGIVWAAIKELPRLIFVSPIENTVTLLDASPDLPKDPRPLNSLGNIIHVARFYAGGWTSMWHGALVGCTRDLILQLVMPWLSHKTSNLMDMIIGPFEPNRHGKLHRVLRKIVIGTVAGSIAYMAVHPIFMLQTRMVCQKFTAGSASSLFAAYRSIVAERGILGLFYGVQFTAMRCLALSVVRFGMETCKPSPPPVDGNSEPTSLTPFLLKHFAWSWSASNLCELLTIPLQAVACRVALYDGPMSGGAYGHLLITTRCPIHFWNALPFMTLLNTCISALETVSLSVAAQPASSSAVREAEKSSGTVCKFDFSFLAFSTIAIREKFMSMKDVSFNAPPLPTPPPSQQQQQQRRRRRQQQQQRF
ncbi:uncharacterized protein MONBRDRAFT_28472 [Monosiga brevicollis MX1]|uniref:Uncharacterized protein n=1 Tax=Monosiga brevicollis TaxID=81824 RepID=A9V898_MONBE|nr:uncharacterized protein MONBRDRAFT_28472 [Monosiga brevicollis MX1]EDQ86301.1 predicted protein [Monosiga brevicollis MX1]|eukprot:XP_001748971.1 hypothetical protein [Monosiga brevicollis MX1]